MRPLCSPFPSPALPSASSSLPVPLQGSILELKAPESPSPSTPTETRAENAARSRIRWVGTVGSSPHAEWVEDAGDLIPRIHTTLAGILPSISSNMSVATVEFLAEGTWHRTYTVYLSTQASSTIVGETMPIADEPKSLKDPQPPSPPPSPHSSSTLLFRSVQSIETLVHTTITFIFSYRLTTHASVPSKQNRAGSSTLTSLTEYAPNRAHYAGSPTCLSNQKD